MFMIQRFSPHRDIVDEVSSVESLNLFDVEAQQNSSIGRDDGRSVAEFETTVPKWVKREGVDRLEFYECGELCFMTMPRPSIASEHPDDTALVSKIEGNPFS